MKWIGVVCVVLIIVPVVASIPYESIPHSFFVDRNGEQNCLIVVGERADSSDIIEAARLAVTIGESFDREITIPVTDTEKDTHENVPPGTCIVETPDELSTLWYFDDFGVYGNGNKKFELWETHEEIQIYIEDFAEFDPLLLLYKGNGYVDFSTIYRIDNVRSPPYIWVYSYTESPRGEHVTGLHYEQELRYRIIDPFFVYNEYIPEICLFGTVYKVVYIDSSILVTGEPYLEYIYLYTDTPFIAGDYTISLLDVDVDHNKCYLFVQGPYVLDRFWMVLDPKHGFSPQIQEIDQDTAGRFELDVWGHQIISGIADLVIDGIKIFIGEDGTIGVYLGVYWVEDVIRWPEKTCCDPFVEYPDQYNFQIRPDVKAVSASEDAYIDQAAPFQNFGALSILSVKSFLNANTRSFVKFDLPVLPEKAIITKATLQMTPVTPTARTYEVSRVVNPWNESSLTWSTQPGVTLTGTQISPAMEWNVTADVLAFYSGTSNYGWRISDQTENSAVPVEILFKSTESNTPPRLIIEYTFDCNHAAEIIPHVQNWINTFYDDIDNDTIPDPVYDIDISLCEPIRTLCDPYFFEGPNYYYYIDFSDTSFDTGVDFTVYQTQKVGSYTVEEIIVEPWELIKIDSEITQKDAVYNWILIGYNTWVKKLVDEQINPDDNAPVNWFITNPGYNLYTDPFGFGNRVLVVAGKTAADTRKAIHMLIEDIKQSRHS